MKRRPTTTAPSRSPPDHVDAHRNKAFVKLITGDFAAGWELYEWRWKLPHNEAVLTEISRPGWRGDEPLAGKTVLLHGEQGYGDVIQFCRYVPMVGALGAKAIFAAPPRLLPLLSTLKGDYTLVEQGKKLPESDLHCPVMSLPLAFKTNLETIPAQVPYLFADPGRTAVWRERLGPKTAPRIGLAWSGNPQHKWDRTRSIPLRRLEPLLRLPCEFHSLQKDIRPEDAAVFAEHPRLRSHHDEQNDFADAAALVAEMDVIVTVDTVIAHLAGALGKPVWIMLTKLPDWRWLMERSDSPWYPTARLFRQSAAGDWSDVLTAVEESLRAGYG